MTDELEQMWDRFPGEPVRWFVIFQKYYLAAGLSRSVRLAHLNYVKETKPDMYEAASQRRGAPASWANMAIKWQWKDRAEAWEQHQTQLAMATVEKASLQLRLLALDAVATLQLFLDNQRLGVQAAKEILDRAGLPATSRVESDNTFRYSADDLAKARDEVQAWVEKQRENG